MRRSNAIAGVGLIMLLGACSSGAPAVDLDEARSSLRAATEAYIAAIQAKNGDAVVDFYAADVMTYPPEAPPITTAAGARAMVEAFLEDPAFAGSFEIGSVEVAASGDLGYTTSTGTLTFTGPDGGVVSERIRDVHVWRRDADGQWKTVIDIWNAAAPPATAGSGQ